MPGRYIAEKVEPLAVFEAEVRGLRRRGSRLVGLCPLHPEKTPSFNVSLKNNLYFCFGCGVGGDAVDLVMRIHRLSFRDAAARLGAWSQLSPAESVRFERERAQRHRAREEAKRQRQAEHDLFLSVRWKLLIAEQWYRSAAAQLAQNPASESLWEVLRRCGEFIRTGSVGFTILGFGGANQRRQYLFDRDISAVLDSGFVVDDRGRRMEVLF